MLALAAHTFVGVTEVPDYLLERSRQRRAAVGLPGDFFPVAFAISRSVGWSAHVLEQVANNRLIRPASEYAGPEPTKKFVPIDER